MTGLSLLQWALLGAGAFMAGFSKIALPGASLLTPAFCALALDARQSTAVVLGLFILGDIFAISYYRHAFSRRIVAPVMPSLILGLILGGAFLYFVTDSGLRILIALILLAMTAYSIWDRRKKKKGNARAACGRAVKQIGQMGPGGRLLYGVLGGFGTMTANVGGPVVYLYLFRMDLSVKDFLSANAWIFFFCNLLKLPVSAGLDLFSLDTLEKVALLAVFLVPGVGAGILLVKKISRELFEWIVYLFTVISALSLLR